MQRVNLVTTTASLAVQYNHIKDSQYVESQEPSNWTVSWLSHQWSKKTCLQIYSAKVSTETIN